MITFSALCILVGLVCIAESAHCSSTVPIHGSENDYEVLDLTNVDDSDHVKLVSKVKNGKLYQVTIPNSNGTSVSSYYLTHLYGTPYEMGYAQGELLGPQINQFIDDTWEYFKSQIGGALPKYFPPWLSNFIETLGLDAALDFTELAVYDFIDSDIFEEIQGISDASGLEYHKIMKVHMIAGLTQGKCSMFGMWGQALAPEYRNSLLQLRALDWDMDGPFRDHSALTVYHPTDGTNAFINIGMVGFVGSLTGISSAQMGISEIGVSFPDKVSFGSESRIGIPFIFLLRDILKFDSTVDDSINRLSNAKRTCDLILGVGDGKSNEFRGFAYSSSELHVFDDKNMLPLNDTWHPRIPSTVYWGMDWICPAFNAVLSEQLLQYHGKITPEIAIKYVTSIEMSGDNHIAFYDLTGMKFYVSFAAYAPPLMLFSLNNSFNTTERSLQKSP
eukprot:TRINITY_DN7179_c0_g1_i1.p1 TRINITY_DN7179_c0_g1~~TRINITY_DN7179_c0_g1_i1.p1  ORF type:complete len:445 (-),score=71.80 TRINITY_DN7179_c0_g1_i1:193-1527(-)